MTNAIIWPTQLPNQASVVPATMPNTAPAAIAMTMAGNMKTTPTVYRPFHILLFIIRRGEGRRSSSWTNDGVCLPALACQAQPGQAAVHATLQVLRLPGCNSS